VFYAIVSDDIAISIHIPRTHDHPARANHSQGIKLSSREEYVEPSATNKSLKADEILSLG
jgi:hypothetical protein